MSPETWLIKVTNTVKSAISNGLETVLKNKKNNTKPPQKSNIGVLAFEIAGLMSKILQLWRSLTDKQIIRLRQEVITLEGVRKIVSNDDSFLLGLACAEMVESLRFVCKSVSRLGVRCNDLGLQNFNQIFEEFASQGKDSYNWVLNWKEMEIKLKKMDKLVSATASLYRELESLSELEQALKKLQACDDSSSNKSKKITDLQQKFFWQKQEVRYVRESSLWNRSYDDVVTLLSRSVFTILARIRLVFGVGEFPAGFRLAPPESLSRSLSLSATVYPSETTGFCRFGSGPLGNPLMAKPEIEEKSHLFTNIANSPFGFINSNSKLLNPPDSTLGANALALHYANVIIVIEKLVRSPHLIGADVRDDLYGMLPTSIRISLKVRLNSYSKNMAFSAADPGLAAEWSKALTRILEWLAPLAHNLIKWQSERNFEQHHLVPRTNVLLLQTLFFANQAKTEAAITELLVGLNYIWRFERELNAKALFECARNCNFNDFPTAPS